jgi:hypothetical protein
VWEIAFEASTLVALLAGIFKLCHVNEILRRERWK